MRVYLVQHGKAFAGFTVLMHAEAEGVIEEGGRVVGVRAVVDGRPEEIRNNPAVIEAYLGKQIDAGRATS